MQTFFLYHHNLLIFAWPYSEPTLRERKEVLKVCINLYVVDIHPYRLLTALEKQKSDEILIFRNCYSNHTANAKAKAKGCHYQSHIDRLYNLFFIDPYLEYQALLCTMTMLDTCSIHPSSIKLKRETQ